MTPVGQASDRRKETARNEHDRGVSLSRDTDDSRGLLLGEAQPPGGEVSSVSLARYAETQNLSFFLGGHWWRQLFSLSPRALRDTDDTPSGAPKLVVPRPQGTMVTMVCATCATGAASRWRKVAQGKVPPGIEVDGRCTAEAGREGDRDRQRPGDRSQGTGQGMLERAPSGTRGAGATR